MIRRPHFAWSKHLIAASAATALLALAACGTPDILEEEPPPEQTAPALPENLPEAPSARLVIAEPNAAAALSTDRIAVWQDPLHVEYYAGSRWVETAPELWHAVLIDAFQDASLEAVGRSNYEVNPNYRLETELRDFEAGYENGAEVPTVRVELTATLLRQPSQDVVASRTFRADRTPGSAAVADVIRAFDRAADAVIGDLAAWSVRQMADG